jgi:hypothetical protein
VSASYYLHCTDFPESVHIGVSAGSHWATDCSPISDRPEWTSTPTLIAYLAQLAGRQAEYRYPPWVADEYGKILTPGETAALIVTLTAYQDYGHPLRPRDSYLMPRRQFR